MSVRQASRTILQSDPRNESRVDRCWTTNFDTSFFRGGTSARCACILVGFAAYVERRLLVRLQSSLSIPAASLPANFPRDHSPDTCPRGLKSCLRSWRFHMSITSPHELVLLVICCHASISTDNCYLSTPQSTLADAGDVAGLLEGMALRWR